MFLNTYLQNYLHIKLMNECYLKDLFITLDCRLKSAKIYMFLILFTFLKSLFYNSNYKFIFKKKKSKLKNRKKNFKDLSICFKIHKNQLYTPVNFIFNSFMNDSFFENHALIFSVMLNKNSISDTIKDNLFFTSHSTGLSINYLLKLISPLMVSQLEIQTLLKPVSNNFYMKFHISSDLEGFFFGLFYMHNMHTKQLYTFNL